MANLILPERKRLYLPGTPQQFTADAYDYRPVLSVSAPGFNDNNVPGNALTHAVRAQSGYSDVGWGATGDGTSANTSRYRYTHNALNTQTLTVVTQVTPKPFNSSYTPILVESTPNSNTNSTLGPFLILPYHSPVDGSNTAALWTISMTGYSGGIAYAGQGIDSPRIGQNSTIAIVFDRSYAAPDCTRAVYVNGVKQPIAAYGVNNMPANTVFATSDLHIHARGVDGSPSLHNYATLTHGLALFNSNDEGFAQEISKDLRAVYRPQKRVVYFDTGAGGGGSSFSLSNTLSNVSNSLGFEVSPKLSISNTLNNVSSALSFSSAGSQFAITNTLDSIAGALSFEVSPEFAIANTLDNLSSALIFEASPKLSIANTLDGLSNTLVFSGAGSIVTIGNTLANISSALSFEVSPVLTLSNTLSDTANALSFTVNQSEFALANTLSNVTNVLSFSVAGSVTLTPEDISAIADAVWSKVIEDLRADEMMRIMLAALAGKREGLGTLEEIYYGVDGVKQRIVFTPTDANGNGDPVIDGSP